MRCALLGCYVPCPEPCCLVNRRNFNRRVKRAVPMRFPGCKVSKGTTRGDHQQSRHAAAARLPHLRPI